MNDKITLNQVLIAIIIAGICIWFGFNHGCRLRGQKETIDIERNNKEVTYQKNYF